MLTSELEYSDRELITQLLWKEKQESESDKKMPRLGFQET